MVSIEGLQKIQVLSVLLDAALLTISSSQLTSSLSIKHPFFSVVIMDHVHLRWLARISHQNIVSSLEIPVSRTFNALSKCQLGKVYAASITFIQSDQLPSVSKHGLSNQSSSRNCVSSASWFEAEVCVKSIPVWTSDHSTKISFTMNSRIPARVEFEGIERNKWSAFNSTSK